MLYMRNICEVGSRHKVTWLTATWLAGSCTPTHHCTLCAFSTCSEYPLSKCLSQIYSVLHFFPERYWFSKILQLFITHDRNQMECHPNNKKQDKNTLGFTAWSSVTSTASAWHQLYPGRQLYSNPSFVTLFLSSGLTEHANTVSLHHALTADWSPDSSSTWCHHCLPRPGRVANYPYRFAFTALAKSRLDFVTYWKVPAQREKSKTIQIFKEF